MSDSVQTGRQAARLARAKQRVRLSAVVPFAFLFGEFLIKKILDVNVEKLHIVLPVSLQSPSLQSTACFTCCSTHNVRLQSHTHTQTHTGLTPDFSLIWSSMFTTGVHLELTLQVLNILLRDY